MVLALGKFKEIVVRSGSKMKGFFLNLSIVKMFDFA